MHSGTVWFTLQSLCRVVPVEKYFVELGNKICQKIRADNFNNFEQYMFSWEYRDVVWYCLWIYFTVAQTDAFNKSNSLTKTTVEAPMQESYVRSAEDKSIAPWLCPSSHNTLCSTCGAIADKMYRSYRTTGAQCTLYFAIGRLYCKRSGASIWHICNSCCIGLVLRKYKMIHKINTGETIRETKQKKILPIY